MPARRPPAGVGGAAAPHFLAERPALVAAFLPYNLKASAAGAVLRPMLPALPSVSRSSRHSPGPCC